ncbi:MAG: radical SAM protein [Acidobacteria bacterium]|nr:radical SAM protein [Acidobacteriota bacterium]
MANLSITAVCNRACGYCFASGTWNGGPAYMAWADYVGALGLLERSGIDQVRLLGGEPTLHPEFLRMLNTALERGSRVLVFTNGLMPRPALERLEGTPADRVAVLVNVAAPEESSVEERTGQAETLARLGLRVTLGLNIQTPGFQPDFLLELIRLHGLARTIRFGLAHPCLDGSNRYLHPRHYRAVGERLARFRRRAEAEGVALELDCGFVPCMFPPETGEWSSAGCGPAPDVLPDGAAISCYPLYGLRRERLEAGVDAAELRRRFDAAGGPLRAEGRCDGGCLAAAMLRFRRGTSTMGGPT